MPQSRDDERPRADREEPNPFVAFRRLIDEQFAAAFRALKPLHSHSDEEFWQRFGASYERSTNPERRQIESPEGNDDTARRSRPHHWWQRQCPAGHQVYEPQKQVNDTEGQLSDTPRVREWTFGPFQGVSFTATYPQEWERAFEAKRSGDKEDAVDTAALSPYSPLRLEKECPESVNWRQAFEDLMAAETDSQMLGKSPLEVPRAMPHAQWLGSLWMRDLIDHASDWQREMLGLSRPQIHSAFSQSPFTNGPSHEREESSATELDFYEKQEEHTRSEKTTLGHDEGQTPSIVSVMTTVQRSRRPDGSVTTKRVLKRRFADGREESEDSTTETLPHAMQNQTRHEESHDSSKRLTAEIKKEQAEAGSSWFWSR